jgi:hypothetical protein
MATYTVKQGDCISSIADEVGFFWETLWNHPSNAALKRKRKNPNTLLPGDEIFIPEKRPKEEQCAATKRHRFRIKGIPVKLNLRLLDTEGKPRKNLPYTLTVDGRPKNAKTDGDGKIAEVIQPNAKKAKLVVKPPGEPEEEYDFDLGHMNPVDDVAGWQSRLQNLGYLREVTRELDDQTAEAVKKFQKAAGLSQTGEMDSATQAALEQRHGG